MIESLTEESSTLEILSGRALFSWDAIVATSGSSGMGYLFVILFLLFNFSVFHLCIQLVF